MKTNTNSHRLAALLVALAAGSSLHGATKTWVGTTGNWVAGNWSPSGNPAYGDTALFNATLSPSSVDLATTLTTLVGNNQSINFQFDTADCAPYTINGNTGDIFFLFSGQTGAEVKATVVQNQTLNVNFGMGSRATPSFNILRASGPSPDTAAKLILNGKYTGGLTTPGLASYVRLTGTNGYGIMNGVISDGAAGGAILLDRADVNAGATWELNAANTYTGGTDFGRAGQNNGTLILGHKAALGAGELRLVMGSVAPVLAANTDLSDKTATGGSNNALSNPVSFNGFVGGTALTGKTVTFTAGSNTATINDSTGVVAGMSIVAANNIPFQTVITAVDGSTLTMSNPARIAGANVASTINSYSSGGGGTLVIAGAENLEFTGAVQLTPAVKTNGAAAVTTVQTDNTALTTFSGALLENGGQPLGAPGTFGAAASFVKTGNGTLVLGGTNTYTGSTRVNAGTLLIKGSIGASTAVVAAPDRQVTVAFGATLGGKGTVVPETVINGSLRPDAPGTAGGKMTFGSVLELAPGSITEFDFGGAIFTGIKLTTSNSLTYGGSMGVNFQGTIFNGSYRLFEYPGTATGAFSDISINGSAPAALTDPNEDGVWTGASGAVAYNFSSATGILTVSGATAPPAPPAAVTGLTATGGVGQVALDWSPLANATRYIVSQSNASGGPYTVLSDSVTGNSFVSTGLGSLTTYYYIVQAANAIGTGAASAQASATTLLSAPAGLTYTVGNGLVNLSWNAVNGATSYLVRRSFTPGGPYDDFFPASGTTYQDVELINFLDYYYVVAAVNAAETSPDSAEVTAKPLLPFPTNPPTTSAIPGDASITLNWTAGTDVANYVISSSLVSGGPFTYLTTLGGETFTYQVNGLVNGTTYYYRIRASNARGFSQDTGEVSATPASLISLWLALHFTEAERLDSAISGNDADPDGDGLTNLMEYATASNPRAGSASPLTLGTAGGALTLTFNHIADPALFYRIKSTTDPTDFPELVQEYTGYTGAGPETFVDTTAITPGQRRFLRLEVTLPAP